VDEASGIEVRDLDLQSRGLGPGEFEGVVDDVFEAVGFAQGHLDALVAGLFGGSFQLAAVWSTGRSSARNSARPLGLPRSNLSTSTAPIWEPSGAYSG
jgi:hypothetical protein